MIVGLSGYARSGKDTAAKALTEQGYTRVAFADKLREVAYALNPVVEWGIAYDPEECEEYASREYLQTIVDDYGWERAKTEYPEVRRILQRIGTEAGREIYGNDFWVVQTLKNPDDDLVVTDVRFPNEADAIQDLGGLVIRIERPGVEAANAHPSETALDNYDFDAEIENDGSEKWLQKQVKDVVYSWLNS